MHGGGPVTTPSRSGSTPTPHCSCRMVAAHSHDYPELTIDPACPMHGASVSKGTCGCGMWARFRDRCRCEAER